MSRAWRWRKQTCEWRMYQLSFKKHNFQKNFRDIFEPEIWVVLLDLVFTCSTILKQLLCKYNFQLFIPSFAPSNTPYIVGTLPTGEIIISESLRNNLHRRVTATHTEAKKHNNAIVSAAISKHSTWYPWSSDSARASYDTNFLSEPQQGSCLLSLVWQVGAYDRSQSPRIRTTPDPPLPQHASLYLSPTGRPRHKISPWCSCPTFALCPYAASALYRKNSKYGLSKYQSIWSAHWISAVVSPRRKLPIVAWSTATVFCHFNCYG